MPSTLHPAPAPDTAGRALSPLRRWRDRLGEQRPATLVALPGEDGRTEDERAGAEGPAALVLEEWEREARRRHRRPAPVCPSCRSFTDAPRRNPGTGALDRWCRSCRRWCTPRRRPAAVACG